MGGRKNNLLFLCRDPVIPPTFFKNGNEKIPRSKGSHILPPSTSEVFPAAKLGLSLFNFLRSLAPALRKISAASLDVFFFFGGGSSPLRIYGYCSFGHVLCFVMLSLFPGWFNLLLSNVHLAGDVMSKNPCKLCMSSVLHRLKNLVKASPCWPRRMWWFAVYATQLSHEKNPLTFHYTGCLIGILIMVYYNP